MICDGAKASCAAKIASAVEAGLLGWKMQQHRAANSTAATALSLKGVENTIRNVGTLASEGMRETDRDHHPPDDQRDVLRGWPPKPRRQRQVKI